MRIISKGWKYSLTPWFLVLLFTAGCALHMPVSEEIMFSRENQTGEIGSEHSLLHYRGMGSSFSASFYTSAFKKQNYSKYGSTYDTDLNSMWQYGFAAYAFTFGVGENISLAISPGAIVYGSGLDGTWRIADTFFLTTTVNIYRNMEIIVQRRIHPRFSAGLFYRHEKQEFGMHETLQRDKLIPADLLGVRGLYNWRHERFSLRGFASVGIETGTLTPVLLTGFAFTLAPRRRVSPSPRVQ